MTIATNDRSPGRICSRAGVSAVICLVLCTSAAARVTQIKIDSRSPAFANQSFGATGPYEILKGRVFGEVDPTDRRNAIIQDIQLAPRNGKGRVEYLATFTLLRPLDAAKGNGALLYSVANRGTRIQGESPGDTFLYRQGYTVLSSGWQGDLTPVPTATQDSSAIPIEAIAVPRVRNPDGSPITGPYLVRIPTLGPQGPSGDLAQLDQGRAGPLRYLPASLDTQKARLWSAPAETIRGEPTGKRQEIDNAAWMWVDCATGKAPATTTLSSELCVKLRQGAFDPEQVYTLTFTARDPLVLGLGFAATRDIVSFFRYAKQDDSGNANPVFGTVPHVIGRGDSQTGNVVKSFIHLGFNEDESGRIVWDGANAHVAGRFAPVNFRFAIPGGSATLHAPGSEAILWWGTAEDPVRGKGKSSLLDRCRVTKTCPKIFETFSSSEFWNQRMSVGLVGTDGARDIPLPSNVRRYYFPGTQHGGGSGAFRTAQPDGGKSQTSAASASTSVNPRDFRDAIAQERNRSQTGCLLPPNPNSMSETMRALMTALTAWVANGTMPPDSRYPSLQAGLLTTDKQGAFRFPSIPGVPLPHGLANPLLDYDYGPHLNGNDLSGYIDRQPPAIRRVIPMLVPTVNADGNETSGAPSVLHRAPLGTYTGWNIVRSGVFAGQICSFTGGFVPFASTRAERLKSADPRLSIEERYGSRQGYLCAVRKAIRHSVKERLLLQEDAQRLIEAATAATSSGDLAFLPATSTARSEALCAEAEVKSGSS